MAPSKYLTPEHTAALQVTQETKAKWLNELGGCTFWGSLPRYHIYFFTMFENVILTAQASLINKDNTEIDWQPLLTQVSKFSPRSFDKPDAESHQLFYFAAANLIAGHLACKLRDPFSSMIDTKAATTLVSKTPWLKQNIYGFDAPMVMATRYLKQFTTEDKRLESDFIQFMRWTVVLVRLNKKLEDDIFGTVSKTQGNPEFSFQVSDAVLLAGVKNCDTEQLPRLQAMLARVAAEKKNTTSKTT